MPIRFNNAIVYSFKEIPTDVILEGVSVIEYGVLEVGIEDAEMGWGYVLLEKKLPTDVETPYNKIVDGEPTVDGFPLNITYRGIIELVA